MQWIKCKKEPMYAFFSGGAVLESQFWSKHYIKLCKGIYPQMRGKVQMIQEYFSVLTQVKAAFNIDGQTIASVFHHKINQKQQNRHCDELNTFRTKYRNLSVVIIDEISMVGNGKLEFINSRLQLLTGLKKAFGGINIIAELNWTYFIDIIQKDWTQVRKLSYSPLLVTNIVYKSWIAIQKYKHSLCEISYSLL